MPANQDTIYEGVSGWEGAGSVGLLPGSLEGGAALLGPNGNVVAILLTSLSGPGEGGPGCEQPPLSKQGDSDLLFASLPLILCPSVFDDPQIGGPRGEKGQKGEPAIIEPVRTFPHSLSETGRGGGCSPGDVATPVGPLSLCAPGPL